MFSKLKSQFLDGWQRLRKNIFHEYKKIRSPGEQKYLPRNPIDCEQIKSSTKAKKQLKKDGRETFWPIQEYFLSIVKPKIVIANGSIARDLFWNKIMNSEFSGSKVQENNIYNTSFSSANKFCYFFRSKNRKPLHKEFKCFIFAASFFKIIHSTNMELNGQRKKYLHFTTK